MLLGKTPLQSPPARYRRLPLPVRFPDDAGALVNRQRHTLRTILCFILRTLGERHTIGCSQLIYWNAADPSRWLSPDAFVRLGVPDAKSVSWKTWERGAPEIAIEIAGAAPRGELAWGEKLLSYRELGVQELVRFDPDEQEGERLRIWDRVEGDLVERVVEDDRGACAPLGLTWTVAPAWDVPRAIRLAFDPEARSLLLTPEEALRRAREAEVRAASRARETERRACEAAEQRVAELTAALLKRST
jgi:hypothetical protein